MVPYTPGVACRAARLEDLDTALQIVQQAYGDLRMRHGYAAPGGVRPLRFQRFCLAEEPGGLWIAEFDGDPVGFGFSWMRQSFWYLAQLFVRPDFQGRGIGQLLLATMLRHAEDKGAGNRALVTTSYNAAAMGLYIRHGLRPREVLLRMSVPADRLAASPSTYGVKSIEPWPGCQTWLGEIDESTLGFRRGSHHAFLLANASRGLRIEHAGRRPSYAYISARGHIGPLAIAGGADPKDVVRAAIQGALEEKPEQLSLLVSGNADDLVTYLLEAGFRIDEAFVLHAAHRFGNWCNYLPGSPGFM